MANRELLEEKELSELKAIADDLAIEYPRNISKKKIIDKIIDDEEDTVGSAEGIKVKKQMTRAEIERSMDEMVRVRISPNAPRYKGLNGVSKKVGNKYKVVGKFIPFDIVWHVQRPILESLKNEKFRETKFKTDPITGNKYPITKEKKALVIEELPPITAEELKKLAADQRARNVNSDNEN